MKKGWLLITAGAVILTVSLVSGEGFAKTSFSLGTKQVRIDKAFDAEAVKNIAVDASSTDIRVVRGSSDQIHVRLDGRESSSYPDKVKLEVQPKGDTLNIRAVQDSGFTIGFDFSDVDLIVELPEKSWDTVKVHASSGNIEVEEVKGRRVEVGADSGNVVANAVESTKLKLQTDSGNIHSAEFAGDELEFKAVSGDVVLEHVQSPLKGETDSGNIHVKTEDLIYGMDLRADSGNVSVRVDHEPQSLTVDFRGGSGNGNIELEGMSFQEQTEDRDLIKGTIGAGEVSLKVRTASGSFHLQQN